MTYYSKITSYAIAMVTASLLFYACSEDDVAKSTEVPDI